MHIVLSIESPTRTCGLKDTARPRKHMLRYVLNLNPGHWLYEKRAAVSFLGNTFVCNKHAGTQSAENSPHCVEWLQRLKNSNDPKQQ